MQNFFLYIIKIAYMQGRNQGRS